jgi:hypothetical protein
MEDALRLVRDCARYARVEREEGQSRFGAFCSSAVDHAGRAPLPFRTGSSPNLLPEEGPLVARDPRGTPVGSGLCLSLPHGTNTGQAVAQICFGGAQVAKHCMFGCFQGLGTFHCHPKTGLAKSGHLIATIWATACLPFAHRTNSEDPRRGAGTAAATMRESDWKNGCYTTRDANVEGDVASGRAVGGRGRGAARRGE